MAKSPFMQHPGFAQFVPAQIQQLRFDLKRSHLYPRRPDIVAQALMQGPQGPIQYMPQRMGFRKWKTPPWRETQQSGVSSAVRAVRSSGSVIRSTGARALPPFAAPATTVARQKGALRLPQPSDNMELFGQTLTRGVSRTAYRVPPTELDRIARTQSQVIGASNVQKIRAANRAMNEVFNKQAALRGLVRR